MTGGRGAAGQTSDDRQPPGVVRRAKPVLDRPDRPDHRPRRGRHQADRDRLPAAGQQLYGVGNLGGIYLIDAGIAAARPVSHLTVPLVGTAFDVDFDPVANRLRIVSNTGENLRHKIDDPGGMPLAGTTAIDMPLAYPSQPGVATGGGRPVTAQPWVTGADGLTAWARRNDRWFRHPHGSRVRQGGRQPGLRLAARRYDLPPLRGGAGDRPGGLARLVPVVRPGVRRRASDLRLLGRRARVRSRRVTVWPGQVETSPATPSFETWSITVRGWIPVIRGWSDHHPRTARCHRPRSDQPRRRPPLASEPRLEPGPSRVT
ncbi:hypothetical protein FAIPA1_10311 [Frankia sp. AiPs1]